MPAIVAPNHGFAQDDPVAAQVQAHLDAAKVAEAAEDYLAAAEEYRAILAVRPEWSLAHQSLGVSLHLAGRFRQAIEHLREAVRLDDGLWGAFLFLGMDYYQTHQFELAIAALRKSADLNPETLETDRWLGLSYAAVSSHGEAIHHLRRVADADDAEALFALARAYDNRAAQLFESIGRIDPESPFVYLLQAERFAFEGSLDRARAEYRRALGLRPDLAGTLDALAPETEDSTSGADSPDDSFASIRESFAAGDYRGAAAGAKAIVDSQAEGSEAKYWLGRSYKGLARATLERLTEVAPQSHRVDQLEAEAHMDRTEFLKAAEAYGRALRKRPGLPGLRYALGVVYARMGRFEEARMRFEEELERNPDHALARFRLGGLLLEQGEPASALEHLRRAVEANPGLPEARFDLGRAYLETEDFAAAVREFEVYLRSDASNDRAHFLLANAYRGMGRLDDAKRELETYQALSRQRLRKVQQDVRDVADDLKP